MLRFLTTIKTYLSKQYIEAEIPTWEINMQLRLQLPPMFGLVGNDWLLRMHKGFTN